MRVAVTDVRMVVHMDMELDCVEYCWRWTVASGYSTCTGGPYAFPTGVLMRGILTRCEVDYGSGGEPTEVVPRGRGSSEFSEGAESLVFEPGGCCSTALGLASNCVQSVAHFVWILYGRAEFTSFATEVHGC